MRRLLAITVITALICSTGMPVWASACEAMHKAPMCHRTPSSQTTPASHAQHHCDMMMDDDQSGQSESNSIMKDHASECPMQCCMQANAGTGHAIPAAGLIAVLLSSEDHVDVPAVTFITPGFSSHTDRGPPVA